jgi:hypothetical protein
MGALLKGKDWPPNDALPGELLTELASASEFMSTSKKLTRASKTPHGACRGNMYVLSDEELSEAISRIPLKIIKQ